MASSRFPGKPLVDLDGLPMVVRSAMRGRDAGCFERVVIATEDQEIVDVARSHGFESLLTPTFETGTDRVAWAGRALGAVQVVNLQGDEPLFPLDLLRSLARLVPTDPDALWTAADLGLSEDDLVDEDVVKIVLQGAVEWPVDLVETSGFDFKPHVSGRSRQARPAQSLQAIDFHRHLPVPAPVGTIAVHVGVYAGSVELLGRFSALAQTDLERSRRIEPLRALADGIDVRAIPGKWDRAAVDRKEHISRVLDVLRTRGE